ncbi:MAG: RNA methyltransferase [Bacteroidota bacterium]
MYNNFVVEGAKMATEILKQRALELEGIYALESWIADQHELLAEVDAPLYPISPKDLERISSLKTPNSVLVVCKVPTYELDLPTINNSLTLYLDDLQNPGNMGSILRIADWFGLPYVFCSKNCVETYNPKVIQGSMGAFLRTKVISIEFEELMEYLPELPTFAAVLGGVDIFKSHLPKNGMIIIGNEGAGIRETIRQTASHQISIPKGQQGGAESLNAAVATGIICAAFFSQ